MAYRHVCRQLGATIKGSNSRPATTPFTHAKALFSSDHSAASKPTGDSSDAVGVPGAVDADPGPATGTTPHAKPEKGEPSSSPFGFPLPKLVPIEKTILKRNKNADGRDGASGVVSEMPSEPQVDKTAEKGVREGEGGEEGKGDGDGERESDGTEYVIDKFGVKRKRQPVEVEKGHFHEFTAVNKNKG